MARIVIASMQKGAGKTSIIAGLMASTDGKTFGYIKPFGDRLIYFKKRLWDYDSALLTNLFSIGGEPENMSIGFEHAKLRFKYDEGASRDKLCDMAAKAEHGKEHLIIEAGMDLVYGSSVHLDAITLATCLDAKLVVVLTGMPGTIMDEVTFLKKNIKKSDLDLAGIIVNKVHDVDEFKVTHLPAIKELGIDLLGVIPNKTKLTTLTVEYLVEQLFAKVVSEEGATDKVIKSVFVGAMSANAALNEPAFKKEGKLIITSGDRTDLILAAFETGTACVLLTNNILPPPNIIAKAGDRKIPLLLVPWDTYQTANKVHFLESLLTKEDKARVDLLRDLVRNNLDMVKLGL